MKMRVSLLTSLLALCFVFGMTGCADTGGKLASITESKTIVVYTDPNFPPFEFMGATGIEGVDIEIAKAIAEELGVGTDIQNAKFDSIIMALKGGKGDIAVSGFTITEDRKENVDFSDPYINSVQYLILPEGSAAMTVEGLGGKQIGVAKGYTGSLLIDDEINKEEGKLYGTDTAFTEYPSAMEAVLDMNNGKVDVVIMDEYVAKNIVSKNTGLAAFELKYDDGGLASEEYGVAVPKGNQDLLDKINTVIKRIVDEGKIQQWVVQYSE